jgi:glutathione S-transferase
MVRAMKLYGTTTSPFVRRVRIVALELGVPFELISTATPEGDAELRRRTPLWKIPTAVFTEGGAERILWDSHTLIDYLLERHGPGPLRPSTAGDPWHERNLIHAIDGALEAAIQVFYLERDGIAPSAAPYLGKQNQRIASVLSWVESQLKGTAFFEDARLGLAELALLTTLDWMVFRNRYPVAQHPRLMEFLRAHAGRPSVKQTYPAT